MEPKILLKKPLVILWVAGIVFSVAFFSSLTDALFNRDSYAKQTATISNTAIEERIVAGLPVRLKIPGINVSADVEYVGLTSEGAMDVPKGPANVAWFKAGVRPGDIGSAVVAGHEGWKDGIQAVFDNLHKLKTGDKIYVENEKGITTAFVVRESRSYGENDDASEVFGSSDGKAHLNLVTCEGVWNKVKKSYSNRLVVFTDKVDSAGSP